MEITVYAFWKKLVNKDTGEVTIQDLRAYKTAPPAKSLKTVKTGQLKREMERAVAAGTLLPWHTTKYVYVWDTHDITYHAGKLTGIFEEV